MITMPSNKAAAGQCQTYGEGGRVFLYKRNQARCICAGFSFVWSM